MNFASLLASLLLSNPGILSRIGGFFRGRPGLPRQIGPPRVEEGAGPVRGFPPGGRQIIGGPAAETVSYGHHGGLVPSFNMPGRGGGRVDIPHLAGAAGRGDPFAMGAIRGQGESAERMSFIDKLIREMLDQEDGAPEMGAPDVPGLSRDPRRAAL